MRSDDTKSRLEAVLNPYANAADSQMTFNAVERILGENISTAATVKPLIHAYLTSLTDKPVPHQPWVPTRTKASNFLLQVEASLRAYLSSKLGNRFSDYAKYGLPPPKEPT